jgi:predicted peptidase
MDVPHTPTCTRRSSIRWSRRSVSLVLFTALSCHTSAPSPPTRWGFLARTFTEGGTTYRYQIFVPADYDRRRRWPVILFLHGAAERGSDGLLQMELGLGPVVRRNATHFPAIVVFPQAPKRHIWIGGTARLAIRALDETMRDFSGDPNRVYLTGLSMGGYGTWQLALEHPERFAAIVPVAGGIRSPWLVPELRVTGIPAGLDPYAYTAERLRHVPAWLFHRVRDPIIPVNESRHMVVALRRVNAPVRYTEYRGFGHDVWARTYSNPDLWSWLFAQRRSTVEAQ